MWFYSGTQHYLLKVSCESNTVHVACSNCIELWEKIYDNETLILLFKEANPSFEGSDSALMKKALSLIGTDSAHVIRECVVLRNNELSLTSTEKGNTFPCNINMRLSLGSSERLYQELTKNLIGVVRCMDQREKRLIRIIESKDIEIEEYVQEGVEIKRRGVITAPFNMEAFNEDTLKNANEYITENVAEYLGGSLLNKLPFHSEQRVKNEPKETSVEHEVSFHSPPKKKCERVTAIGCQYDTSEDSPIVTVKSPLKLEASEKRKVASKSIKLRL